jgi:multidrug efflux pump subunit AcrB
LTVVPLFCARFIKSAHGEISEPSDHSDAMTSSAKKKSFGASFNAWFTAGFDALLVRYDRLVQKVLEWPRATLGIFAVVFLLSLLLFPFLGLSFFPRTDPAQFVINFKAPSGTKLQATEEETAKLEQLIRQTVSKHDMDLIVSNIGFRLYFLPTPRCTPASCRSRCSQTTRPAASTTSVK